MELKKVSVAALMLAVASGCTAIDYETDGRIVRIRSFNPGHSSLGGFSAESKDGKVGITDASRDAKIAEAMKGLTDLVNAVK